MLWFKRKNKELVDNSYVEELRQKTLVNYDKRLKATIEYIENEIMEAVDDGEFDVVIEDSSDLILNKEVANYFVKKGFNARLEDYASILSYTHYFLTISWN